MSSLHLTNRKMLYYQLNKIKLFFYQKKQRASRQKEKITASSTFLTESHDYTPSQPSRDRSPKVPLVCFSVASLYICRLTSCCRVYQLSLQHVTVLLYTSVMLLQTITFIVCLCLYLVSDSNNLNFNFYTHTCILFYTFIIYFHHKNSRLLIT